MKIEEFKKTLRRYPTWEILKWVSTYSIQMYEGGEATKIVDLGFKCRSFEVTTEKMLKLCFYSIKYGTDHRNKKFEEKDFISLINDLKLIEGDIENSKESLDKDLLIMCNEQFGFGEKKEHIDKFNRIYHILVKINKNKKYKQDKSVNYINFDEEFLNIKGKTLNSFYNCYVFFVLMVLIIKSSESEVIRKNIDFEMVKLGFTKEEMFELIYNEAKEYDSIKSLDNWNVLKSNPIIRNNKHNEEFIITNIFAVLSWFSDLPYWTLRNHFKGKGKQDFLNYFGVCFENYFEEVMQFYRLNYNKIERKNSIKQPDWIVETNKYELIIEQKSALMPLDTKSIYSPNKYNIINKYIDNNVAEAFRQLVSYEEESNGKTKIRICLMFETIYLQDIMENIALEKVDIDKKESPYYWIMNIRDYEKLMYVLSKDENRFDLIVKRILGFKESGDLGYESIEKLLSDEENPFMEKKIDYFGLITDDYREVLKSLK